MITAAASPPMETLEKKIPGKKRLKRNGGKKRKRKKETGIKVKLHDFDSTPLKRKVFKLLFKRPISGEKMKLDD